MTQSLKRTATPHAGPALNRRQLLGASGGLLLGFSLFGAGVMAGRPARAATDTLDVPDSLSVDPARLDAWLAIHPDNTATLYTGKVEQGNGSPNALAQMAAEELDFPFEHLAVVMGTTSVTVDQGPTYGSRAVRYAGPQIRHAAAAGRQILLGMAAERLGVAADALSASDGVIVVVADPARRVTYGELVAGKRLTQVIGATGKTFDMVVAPDARLKDPARYKVVGRSVPRKDIPGKVTGEFTYVQDVRVPGMLHGRVVRPYGVGAELLEVDEGGLADIPGFVRIVREGNFLGVVAKTEWAAIQAAAQLGSRLQRNGPQDGGAKWSDWQKLAATLEVWDAVRHVPGRDSAVAARGNVDEALKTADRALKATYFTPFQMHGSIGPSCAIADVRKDGATFWSGTQMPHQTRRDMAELLGLPAENIEVRWVEASGQYGRNGLEHVVADAALLSRAVGKPVRVQWMRWDEHGWEPKEPATFHEMAAALDAKGKVAAWRHHMWVPTFTNTRLVASELMGKPVGSENLGMPAIGYEYTFANADVTLHAKGRVNVITAWLRSPGQYETTFAMEAFVDELAAAAGVDPLQFRLQYLQDERAIQVLQAAAHKYGWEERPAHDQRRERDGKLLGRGIAWVDRDDSRVATIADVEVDPASGRIRVPRVVVAHDCGLVISPDGLHNQIEGNIIQSLSRTLHEEVQFDHSRVTSLEWGSYPILRFSEIPDSVEMVLVNNDPKYPSTGAGEPSTNPTAAVISNAVFDATGVRLRQIPFTPERVKAALADA